MNNSHADREPVSCFLPGEQASEQPLIVSFSIRRVQISRLHSTIWIKGRFMKQLLRNRTQKKAMENLVHQLSIMSKKLPILLRLPAAPKVYPKPVHEQLSQAHHRFGQNLIHRYSRLCYSKGVNLFTASHGWSDVI